MKTLFVLILLICLLGDVREENSPHVAYHNAQLVSVAFSPNGKMLAAGAGNKVVVLWDATSLEEMRKLEGNEGPVVSIAFSPDGKFLAAGSWGGKLYDVEGGHTLHTLEAHTGFVTGIAYSPDGRKVVTGSLDATAKVWDAINGHELATLKCPDTVNGIAFSSDGKTLVTVTDSGIRLWDTASWKEVRVLKGHEGPVTTVAFTRDGKMLATGGADKTVRLWDVATWQEKHTLTGHADRLLSLVFSPDGKQLLTGSADRTAKLWDLAERRAIRTLEDHGGPVYGVAFSPDGKSIATVSGNAVSVWFQPSPAFGAGAGLQKPPPLHAAEEAVAYATQHRRELGRRNSRTVTVL